MLLLSFISGFSSPTMGGMMMTSTPVQFMAVKNSNMFADPETTIALETQKTQSVWVTAYSSTPEETDDTPFITASGTKVRDGIIATNMLPMKTRVKIPKLFGDKIFVVEDRMHPRKTNFVDVWMPTKEGALRVGITYTEIVVLN